jgi:hypothetical protein
MQFKFFTGGALAALAAALALTAVPASAREADRPGNHGQHQQGTDNNGQHAQRGGGRDHQARPERTAPQPQRDRNSAPQARPQQAQQAQRNWTRQERPQQRQQAQQLERRGWTARGNWTPATRQEQQRIRTPQAQQTQRWAGNDQRTERNRTYSDRNRSTTYSTSGSNWRDGRRDGDRNWRDNRSGSDRNWRDGNRDGRNWDRNWRSNNRYDWQRYRTTNRNAYHIGRYYSPYRNYSYRRLSIGFGLDSLFYSSRYWISDPWQYRLPEAYGPYRWVRYYDDALLVDIYSGEVVDVIYDFFW